MEWCVEAAETRERRAYAAATSVAALVQGLVTVLVRVQPPEPTAWLRHYLVDDVVTQGACRYHERKRS